MIVPNGAQPIIDARKRGFRPAEMLIVSLIGKVDELNHTIYANPKGEYDWRWIVGLDACIYVKPGIDWKPIAMSIARCKPHWLGVYDVDRFQGAHVNALPAVADIEKSKQHWRWQLHVLPWVKYENEQYAWGE
jgi:hypothetical protein